MRQTITVRLDDLVLDRSIYPRAEIDGNMVDGRVTVAKYLDEMKAGARFPPLLVGRRSDGKYVLIDGHHRYFALKYLKVSRYPALVTTEPESRWLIVAIEANKRHGKPLTAYDKMLCIQRLRDVMRIRERTIAGILGMTYVSMRRMIRKRTALLVGRQRDTSNVEVVGARIERGIKGTISLKSGLVHLAQQEVDGDQIVRTQDVMGVMDQERMLEQVAKLCRTDTFNLENNQIRLYLVEIYNWLRRNRPRYEPRRDEDSAA